jgi:S1-C subfamily serine protease
MLAGGLAAALALGGAGFIGHELTNTGSPAAATSAQPAAMRTVSGSTSPSAIYASAKDAVTYIVADTPEGQATGSGFVVSKDGYIVTNDHVVDGATSVKVMLGTSKTAQTAKVVGIDPSRDLALLKVDGHDLKTLSLGNSSSVGVGDATYAIGNPFGLDSTFTTGIVSALNRSLQAPDGATISGAIQTDAPLNPGNSGGPLVDGTGRVVGINTAMIGAAQGICFAIGIDTAADVAARIMRDGRVRRSRVGIAAQTVSLDRRLARRLKLATPSAGMITDVVAGGPAERAGIGKGDIVLHFAGEAIRGVDDLHRLLTSERANTQVMLQLLRAGQLVNRTVTPELDS